ncbi:MULTISPECIES: DUF4245 domain-containing protein [unclassified Pseudofrankia]|uniref:DUF4245 domain-containing protein n=1 Tax=unclassified Pseudofrankia TaxID=2994372 RepID=UPI0009F2B96C|nr:MULTISPECIES: DUF4245 domain-containing protein [unclassified Pseudofrankia]MDT3441254.1 DUF4245 domain-containing protein [Pseudofrankia sp. BMG5.37]
MARKRGQETIRDMTLSLAVVMAGVFAFVFFVLPRGDDEQAVKVVDNAAVSVTSFARQAPYQVLAPSGLAQDLWKPTSLRVQAPGAVQGADTDLAVLTIGYVVDRKGHRTFARYEVSNAPDAVQRLLGNRPVTGHRAIAGETWDERRDDDGHLALTRTAGGSIVIVDDGDGSGGASPADLDALAASVRLVSTASS